jgi:hypothetical protein
MSDPVLQKEASTKLLIADIIKSVLDRDNINSDTILEFVSTNDLTEIEMDIINHLAHNDAFLKFLNDLATRHSHKKPKTGGGMQRRRPNASKMTASQIREELRSAGASGYSRATKPELEAMLRASRRQR